MFKEAQELAEATGGAGAGAALSKDLLEKQGDGEVISGNWKEGAKLYTQAQCYKKAIKAYGDNGVLDQMQLILKVLDN